MALNEKMVNREKKRDKFYTKMWKGVKEIFKLFKPKNWLPFPRFESDDEAPTKLSTTYDGGDDAISAGESTSWGWFRKHPFTLILLIM